MSKYFFLISSILIVSLVIFEESQVDYAKDTVASSFEKVSPLPNTGAHKKDDVWGFTPKPPKSGLFSSKKSTPEKEFRMVSSKVTTSIASLPALIAAFVYLVFALSGIALLVKLIKRRYFSAKNKELNFDEQEERSE